MKKTAVGRETLGGRLLLLAAAAIFVIAVAGALGGAGDSVSAATREERAALLRDLGHTPDIDSETEKHVRLPTDFPAVLDNYEQLQRSQGLSLKKYAGKEIHIYTCPLVEDGQEGVYSALYIYRGKVIGGDVHSVDFEGYMRPLFPASENG